MKTAQKRNILIILVIIAALITGVVIYSFNNQPVTTSSSQQTKTFQSKNLKFSVVIPSNLQTEEKFTHVIFQNNEMDLRITRNGTNFETLDDFLNDLSQKNKMIISDKKILNINSLPAIKGSVKYPGGPSKGESTYYIKAGSAVYILSTTDQILFNDLDQIAQSFRYEP